MKAYKFEVRFDYPIPTVAFLLFSGKNVAYATDQLHKYVESFDDNVYYEIINVYEV